MSCFEGTFGDTLCHVDVIAQPLGISAAVYTATPFRFAADGHVAHWFVDDRGHHVSLTAGTEAGALSLARAFLVARLGPERDFGPVPDGRHPVGFPIEEPQDRRGTV